MAGATGLVGRAVLAALTTADSNAGLLPAPPVHVLYARGRTPPTHVPDQVQVHAVDFGSLTGLPPIDDVYIALGTTIRSAGSQAAFRAVDHDAVLAVARAALAAGATRCALVSAMGAHPDSRMFYSRVKGETERDVIALGLPTLVIARPSLLAGDRAALRQPSRPAEQLSLRIVRALKPVIPPDYRAVDAEDVALALIRTLREAPAGVHYLSGRALLPP